MRYDARTVFAAALAWWESQPGSDLDFRTMRERRHVLRLRVYVRGDDTGCFLLTGADKTYWEPTGEAGFRNTDRTLAEEAESLGHVILSTHVTQQERLWPTWAEFAQAVGLDQL